MQRQAMLSSSASPSLPAGPPQSSAAWPRGSWRPPLQRGAGGQEETSRQQSQHQLTEFVRAHCLPPGHPDATRQPACCPRLRTRGGVALQLVHRCCQPGSARVRCLPHLIQPRTQPQLGGGQDEVWKVCRQAGVGRQAGMERGMGMGRSQSRAAAGTWARALRSARGPCSLAATPALLPPTPASQHRRSPKLRVPALVDTMTVAASLVWLRFVRSHCMECLPLVAFRLAPGRRKADR